MIQNVLYVNRNRIISIFSLLAFTLLLGSNIYAMTYECPICKEHSENKKALEYHYKTYHPKVYQALYVAPLTCLYCSHEFQKQSDLDTHYKDQHPDNNWIEDLVSTCRLCKKNFNGDKTQLKAHYQTLCAQESHKDVFLALYPHICPFPHNPEVALAQAEGGYSEEERFENQESLNTHVAREHYDLLFPSGHQCAVKDCHYTFKQNTMKVAGKEYEFPDSFEHYSTEHLIDMSAVHEAYLEIELDQEDQETEPYSDMHDGGDTTSLSTRHQLHARNHFRCHHPYCIGRPSFSSRAELQDHYHTAHSGSNDSNHTN